MPFERFTETGRGFAPKASIARSGMIGLNSGAVRRYEVDKHPYCVLYYDSDTRRIGMELTDDADAPGARMIRLGRAGGAFIGARSFLEYYDITPPATMLYPVGHDDEAKLLVLDLKLGRARKTTKR